MKLFVLVLLLSIFCGLTVCQLISSLGIDWVHDIFEGDCGESQQSKYVKLMDQQVNKDHSIFHHVTANVEYSGDNVVRCIKVDNLMEHYGAEVAIVGGGIGAKNVKLQMQSKLSHAIHFQVLILGDNSTSLHL